MVIYQIGISIKHIMELKEKIYYKKFLVLIQIFLHNMEIIINKIYLKKFKNYLIIGKKKDMVENRKNQKK